MGVDLATVISTIARMTTPAAANELNRSETVISSHIDYYPRREFVRSRPFLQNRKPHSHPGGVQAWPQGRKHGSETRQGSTAYCDDIEPGSAMDTLGRTRIPKTGEIAPTVNREGHSGKAIGPTLLQSAVSVVCWGRTHGLESLEIGLRDA
jgi:hypothetical protein